MTRNSMPVRLAVALLVGGATVALHAATPAGVPFKLGTFELGGQARVGLVLRDSVVVDIAAANQEFERRNRRAAKVRAPADMKELIARYESDVGPRLRELAQFASDARAASYVHQLSGVKTLPPVMPQVMLNAARASLANCASSRSRGPTSDS
jgi:hypothetical protein